MIIEMYANEDWTETAALGAVQDPPVDDSLRPMTRVGRVFTQDDPTGERGLRLATKALRVLRAFALDEGVPPTVFRC